MPRWRETFFPAAMCCELTDRTNSPPKEVEGESMAEGVRHCPPRRHATRQERFSIAARVHYARVGRKWDLTAHVHVGPARRATRC